MICDLADAVDRLDAFLDLVLGDLGHLAKRASGGDRDTQHGRGVGIELLNGRLLGCFGQVRNDGLNAVLDLLRGDVNVLFENELDEHLRDALDRRRAQLVDAADRVDRLLDLFGDLGLDLLRRRTGIRDRHRDRREIDLWKEVDAERQERERADHDERHHQASSRRPAVLHILQLTTAYFKSSLKFICRTRTPSYSCAEVACRDDVALLRRLV